MFFLSLSVTLYSNSSVGEDSYLSPGDRAVEVTINFILPLGFSVVREQTRGVTHRDRAVLDRGKKATLLTRI